MLGSAWPHNHIKETKTEGAIQTMELLFCKLGDKAPTTSFIDMLLDPTVWLLEWAVGLYTINRL